MNANSNAVPETAADGRDIVPAAIPAVPATRPLYWSVRRELWENRSIYIAPLVVAAVVLFGSSIGLFSLPRQVQKLPVHDTAGLRLLVSMPFSIAPAPIMFVTFLVGIFYSLDALYGERRDRSILFWKSLPVSDLTTVLSKASIPLVVLPLVGFVLGVATLVIMLVLSTALFLANGLSLAILWTAVRFFPLIMLYGLTVNALWFAPIYAWLLLVSVWARRMPVLWALLPPFAIAIVEKIGFSTSHFPDLLRYRLAGAMLEAFAARPRGRILNELSLLTPMKFLSSPGLWVGLLLAVGFLAAAVRLRRYREPI